MGMGGQRHAPVVLPWEGDLLPIVHEAGWPPRPVSTGVENFAPTGIRSWDHPARSGSLYRLSYPGPSLQLLRYGLEIIVLYPDHWLPIFGHGALGDSRIIPKGPSSKYSLFRSPARA
jgi:hypothetical protein